MKNRRSGFTNTSGVTAGCVPEYTVSPPSSPFFVIGIIRVSIFIERKGLNTVVVMGINIFVFLGREGRKEGIKRGRERTKDILNQVFGNQSWFVPYTKNPPSPPSSTGRTSLFQVYPSFFSRRQHPRPPPLYLFTPYNLSSSYFSNRYSGLRVTTSVLTISPSDEPHPTLPHHHQQRLSSHSLGFIPLFFRSRTHSPTDPYPAPSVDPSTPLPPPLQTVVFPS